MTPNIIPKIRIEMHGPRNGTPTLYINNQTLPTQTIIQQIELHRQAANNLENAINATEYLDRGTSPTKEDPQPLADTLNQITKNRNQNKTC